ncbi:hypothetical protein DFQ11_102325 [Winogradskyella epiphytica]|uniref:Uncharacterized protein n=1 Tax=Winogradskyella epiphytica TaxID=262005 RepID=A0A2V4XTQ6_9FLAO|nr:DUF6638 family protein [Winogradskyella epiphytica]PYE81751.1 hypothetical protein DFQ11_102325 [Winogradskyella epiphytica]GGW62928.1 hypothetical protein GCM10008085_13440 [Winogradskyella epiphytica]
MNKLEEAKLYRSELIPISGKLIERYNKCLKTLGFTETNLTSFFIDGIGWSPEVAEEKKNMHYLNHGDANPHGIIITPLQKGKPVYLPFHSFDKEMMQHVFRTHGAKINDITRDSAVCIDFDQNIDVFYEPLDVLKYDNVDITFRLIDNLEQVQKDQLYLVEKFNRDTNFIDENIHQELLNSARTYGDLRERDLDLHPLNFTTGSFYTRAFDGVYLLRDFIKPIVIFESEASYKEAIKDTIHDVLIYHISQPELVAKLKDHIIIECDLEHMVSTSTYERVKKYELAQFLKETQHPIKDILNDKVLFKSYLNKIDIESRKRVMSVELYLEKLERSNAYKIEDIVDQEFYFALHQPHSSLSAEHRDLIHKLLINIAPLDVLFLYWYDKEQFYKNYETWDDSFKDWVIERIRNNI